MEDQSNYLPSIISESEDLQKLLYAKYLKHEDSETDKIDLAKVKKIEFSQSFKKEKLEEPLPFTHANLDKLVFQGSLKNKDFKIEDA